MCRVSFKGETEFKKHIELEHGEVMSPKAKKRKHDEETTEEVKSGKSLEEITIIDVEMAEEEENGTLTKILEKQNDEKVLIKQEAWFEKEVRFQEMKRKMSEEQRKLENKRKRQNSIKKRKDLEVKMMAKEFVDDRIDICVKEVKKDDCEGPGYMGWRMGEEVNEKEDRGLDVNRAQEDIKSLYNLFQGMDIKFKETTKQVNTLKKELKDLKEEFKQCMDALETETYERNKAEAMNNVLKESLEAERRLKTENDTKVDENTEGDMSIDETESQSWTQQRIVSKKKEKVIQYCNQCVEKFRSKSDLEEHIKSKHGTISDSKCEKCDEKLPTVSDRESHMKERHSEENVITYNCNECEHTFAVKEELNTHIISFHAEKVYNCQKCNKPYTSMSLLRRHDWRCHRDIDCNMCGENLKSREYIKIHRENKHQIYQRTFCKYFPNCIDGDECLFEHAQEINGSSCCPNGQNCDDQSCKFSEQRHSTAKVLCKFQTNCNRLNCPYTHSGTRKAFLGEGLKRIMKH